MENMHTDVWVYRVKVPFQSSQLLNYQIYKALTISHCTWNCSFDRDFRSWMFKFPSSFPSFCNCAVLQVFTSFHSSLSLLIKTLAWGKVKSCLTSSSIALVIYLVQLKCKKRNRNKFDSKSGNSHWRNLQLSV